MCVQDWWTMNGPWHELQIPFHYGADQYAASYYGETAMARVLIGVFQSTVVPYWSVGFCMLCCRLPYQTPTPELRQTGMCGQCIFNYGSQSLLIYTSCQYFVSDQGHCLHDVKYTLQLAVCSLTVASQPRQL